MTNSLAARVTEAAASVSGQYNRLILVVGEASSGKTAALARVARELNWPRINVSLTLSAGLLELSHKQRRVRAPHLLGDICRGTSTTTVVLDNIELLFTPELDLDPLRLLQGLSRHQTVIAAWRGTFDGSALTYAAPGHLEARRIVNPAVCVLVTEETDLPAVRSVGGGTS